MKNKIAIVLFVILTAVCLGRIVIAVNDYNLSMVDLDMKNAERDRLLEQQRKPFPFGNDLDNAMPPPPAPPVLPKGYIGICPESQPCAQRTVVKI
jgi:hypothetical protein